MQVTFHFLFLILFNPTSLRYSLSIFVFIQESFQIKSNLHHQPCSSNAPVIPSMDPTTPTSDTSNNNQSPPNTITPNSSITLPITPESAQHVSPPTSSDPGIKHWVKNTSVLRHPQRENEWWSISESEWNASGTSKQQKWTTIARIMETNEGHHRRLPCLQCAESNIQCWGFTEATFKKNGRLSGACSQCRAKGLQVQCSLAVERKLAKRASTVPARSVSVFSVQPEQHESLRAENMRLSAEVEDLRIQAGFKRFLEQDHRSVGREIGNV